MWTSGTGWIEREVKVIDKLEGVTSDYVSIRRVHIVNVAMSSVRAATMLAFLIASLGYTNIFSLTGDILRVKSLGILSWNIRLPIRLRQMETSIMYECLRHNDILDVPPPSPVTSVGRYCTLGTPRLQSTLQLHPPIRMYIYRVCQSMP